MGGFWFLSSWLLRNWRLQTVAGRCQVMSQFSHSQSRLSWVNLEHFHRFHRESVTQSWQSAAVNGFTQHIVPTLPPSVTHTVTGLVSSLGWLSCQFLGSEAGTRQHRWVMIHSNTIHTHRHSLLTTIFKMNWNHSQRFRLMATSLFTVIIFPAFIQITTNYNLNFHFTLNIL